MVPEEWKATEGDYCSGKEQSDAEIVYVDNKEVGRNAHDK